MPRYSGSTIPSAFVSATKFYFAYSSTLEIFKEQPDSGRQYILAPAIVIGSSEQSESCQTLQSELPVLKRFVQTSSATTDLGSNVYFVSATM